MGDELLKLKWNGHLSSFLQIFQSLRLKARYTDVTLACEGQLFTVHRLVLASCSQFFDHIFEQTPAENTVIILNEARASDVEALLDYMYCGQVDVHQSNLASFIRTAKCLQIKGLATPEISEYYNKGKRPRNAEGHTSHKKKRCEVSTASSQLHPHQTEGTPPLASSPQLQAMNALHPTRWGFQRSDLPNTTWSSSQAGVNEEECSDGQPHSSASPYREESWIVDESSRKSPLQSQTEVRLPPPGFPLFSENKLQNSHYVTEQRLYRSSGDYYVDTMDIKSEVKQEQKEITGDDSENFGSSDYSSFNYHPLNTYDRDDSSERFPNSSHATVSPKLMPYAKCSNCLTNNTKLWRRSIKGEIVCNACGLYYKLHGVNRPSHLFRNAPMTRRRNPRRKKKLYEEIAEGRELGTLEDKNDSMHNESGCDDSDTQDGLAVLNAALTLNSLFAKAKAQEAAAAAAAAAKNQSNFHAQGPSSYTSSMEGGANPGIALSGTVLQIEAEPTPYPDPRPPPPPLLKLQHSTRNSPPPLVHSYPDFTSHQKGNIDETRGHSDETPVST